MFAYWIGLSYVALCTVDRLQLAIGASGQSVSRDKRKPPPKPRKSELSELEEGSSDPDAENSDETEESEFEEKKTVSRSGRGKGKGQGKGRGESKRKCRGSGKGKGKDKESDTQKREAALAEQLLAEKQRNALLQSQVQQLRQQQAATPASRSCRGSKPSTAMVAANGNASPLKHGDPIFRSAFGLFVILSHYGVICVFPQFVRICGACPIRCCHR